MKTWLKLCLLAALSTPAFAQYNPDYIGALGKDHYIPFLASRFEYLFQVDPKHPEKNPSPALLQMLKHRRQLSMHRSRIQKELGEAEAQYAQFFQTVGTLNLDKISDAPDVCERQLLMELVATLEKLQNALAGVDRSALPEADVVADAILYSVFQEATNQWMLRTSSPPEVLSQLGSTLGSRIVLLHYLRQVTGPQPWGTLRALLGNSDSELATANKFERAAHELRDVFRHLHTAGLLVALLKERFQFDAALPGPQGQWITGEVFNEFMGRLQKRPALQTPEAAPPSEVPAALAKLNAFFESIPQPGLGQAALVARRGQLERSLALLDLRYKRFVSAMAKSIAYAGIANTQALAEQQDKWAIEYYSHRIEERFREDVDRALLLEQLNTQ